MAAVGFLMALGQTALAQPVKKALVRGAMSAGEWALGQLLEQVLGGQKKTSAATGDLMAQMTGAAGIESLRAIVNDNGQGIGEIQTALPGLVDEAAIANAVWSSILSDSGDFEWTADSALWFAARSAYRDAQWGVLRDWRAPWFLLFGPGWQWTGEAGIPDLRDLNPAARLNGESDLEMCQRLHPEIAWGDVLVPGMAGAWLDGEAGWWYGVYWAGGMSIQEFLAAVTYTPGSGPPARNALQDLVSLITLVPGNWASGSDA